MRRVGWSLTIPVLSGLIALALALPACNKRDEKSSSADHEKIKVFVSGSAAVTPLLKIMATEFSKKEEDIEIVFLPDSHSEAGISGASEERYDIGTVSREMFAGEKEDRLRYLHLARDGLVFVTNVNVRIANLNSDQIRDIYSGKITNWSELGGPDGKIVVIDRPEYTSAKMALRKTFLGDSLAVTPEALTVERPWQVTDSIQMIPYSIGYTSLGDMVLNNPPIRVLSVNGVPPTPANLQDGRYKFIRPLGLILGPAPKAATMRFVNFIFSDTGSHILENSGYVPQRYEIVIGIVPEQNVMVQNQRYQPLVEYLSHRLGERFSVRLKLFSSYIETCRALAEGDINAAFLGSFAYATVHNFVDVLARPDYSGISTYRGIIFVRADSGIQDLDDMKGKRLVLGGSTTTAGYVFPLYFFKKHGITDFRTYFSEATFVGTHEDAILAVLHNKADVGTAKDLIYLMLANENPVLNSSLKIIAQSPPVPSNAFVVRRNLSLPCFDCHRARVEQSELTGEATPASRLNISSTILQYLLDMSKDPEGRQALAALGNAKQFLPTHDSDYSELYKMLEEIGVNPEEFLAGSEEGSF
ncbi:MAG: hypothetical protein Kow0099_20940 [Candidatus Abyssubacteria bacterium]